MDTNPVLALITALGDTQLKEFAPWMPVLVAVAAVLAAILPPVDANSKWAPARKLLDMVAMNVGHAVNGTVIPQPSPANTLHITVAPAPVVAPVAEGNAVNA